MTRDELSDIDREYRRRFKADIYRRKPWLSDRPGRSFRSCSEFVAAGLVCETEAEYGVDAANEVREHLRRWRQLDQDELELEGHLRSVA